MGNSAQGFKLSSVQTDNDFNFFDVINTQNVLNTDRTNRFIYTENVNAGYASFEKSKGKWQTQLGLRIEHTHSEGQLVGMAEPTAESHVVRRYVNAFPSAGLTYNPNQNNTFSLNYSRRIDRPSYESLNPFESKVDELTYQKGNAFLRPQYTNTIQLSHTYKYKLTTSLSYSDTQDYFTSITDTVAAIPGERPRNFITTRNLANQRVVSLAVSYPFNITNWWNVYLNVSGYHSANNANFGDGKTIGLIGQCPEFLRPANHFAAWCMEAGSVGLLHLPIHLGRHVPEPPVLGQHHRHTAQSAERTRLCCADRIGPVQQPAMAGYQSVRRFIHGCQWRIRKPSGSDQLHL